MFLGCCKECLINIHVTFGKVSLSLNILACCQQREENSCNTAFSTSALNQCNLVIIAQIIKPHQSVTKHSDVKYANGYNYCCHAMVFRFWFKDTCTIPTANVSPSHRHKQLMAAP